MYFFLSGEKNKVTVYSTGALEKWVLIITVFSPFRRSFEFLDLLLQEWQTHSLERYGPVYFFPENKLLMNFKTEISSLNPLIGFCGVLGSLHSPAGHVAHSGTGDESCMFQPWLRVASSPYPLPLLCCMWAVVSYNYLSWILLGEMLIPV